MRTEHDIIIDLMEDFGFCQGMLQHRADVTRWAMPPMLVGLLGSVVNFVAPSEWEIVPVMLALNSAAVVPLVWISTYLDLRTAGRLRQHVECELSIHPAIAIVAAACVFAALPFYFYVPERQSVATMMSTTPMAAVAFLNMLNTTPLMKSYQAFGEKVTTVIAEHKRAEQSRG